MTDNLRMNSHAMFRKNAMEQRRKAKEEEDARRDKVLALKRQYIDEYDRVFERIRASVKKSEEHLALLRIEKRLHQRSLKLLSNNAHIFFEARKKIFKDMEDKGIILLEEIGGRV